MILQVHQHASTLRFSTYWVTVVRPMTVSVTASSRPARWPPRVGRRRGFERVTSSVSVRTVSTRHLGEVLLTLVTALATVALRRCVAARLAKSAPNWLQARSGSKFDWAIGGRLVKDLLGSEVSLVVDEEIQDVRIGY